MKTSFKLTIYNDKNVITTKIDIYNLCKKLKLNIKDIEEIEQKSNDFLLDFSKYVMKNYLGGK